MEKQLLKELQKMDGVVFDSIVFVNTETFWVSGPFSSAQTAIDFYMSKTKAVQECLKAQAWAGAI